MRRSWVPSKDHTNTGRLCSAGSWHHPVPRRRSSYAALRLPHSRQPRLRSSLAFGLPRCGRLFCAVRGGRPHAHPADTRRVGDGSPDLRGSGRLTRRNEGLPGFWAVLFVRAVVEDPAGCSSLLAHVGEAAVAFRQSNALGTRNVIAFVAAWPTAHTLAYLRIDAPVTGNAARLATGPGGLTLDRAGFAPAGRRTGFHEVIAFLPSSLTSLAWSLLDGLSAASRFAGLRTDAGSASEALDGT